MTAVQLLVVRHAQTLANLAGRYLGDSDVLSEVGVQQSKCLATALDDFGVSHVLHSGSVRVIQTLEAAATALDSAEIRTEPQLREGSVGAWTGLPGDLRADEARRTGVPLWDVRPPGGESWLDIDRRLGQFIDETVRSFDGRCLLLLGSGRANSLILRRLCGISWEMYDRRQMMHTGISSLRAVTDEVLQMDQCVDHLPIHLRTR